MEFDVDPDEQLSSAVDRAVAAIDGRGASNVRSMADVIDPDALDALFADLPDGTARAGGRLTLRYNDCEITVDRVECVTVECPGRTD